jgi:uncharacterized repeat protein (TIGR01451 family)
MQAIWKHIVGAVVCACAAAPLYAQQSQSPVQTRLEARKVVVAADGKETFAAAESARPGDVIEYTATYRNSGRAPVSNVQATLPIPPHTELVPDSARPANAQASVDGRTFSPLPLLRKVRREGREIDEPVPIREYRYLRWFPGEMAGGASNTFTARVRVIAN